MEANTQGDRAPTVTERWASMTETGLRIFFCGELNVLVFIAPGRYSLHAIKKHEHLPCVSFCSPSKKSCSSILGARARRRQERGVARRYSTCMLKLAVIRFLTAASFLVSGMVLFGPLPVPPLHAMYASLPAAVFLATMTSVLARRYLSLLESMLAAVLLTSLLSLAGDALLRSSSLAYTGDENGGVSLVFNNLYALQEDFQEAVDNVKRANPDIFISAETTRESLSLLSTALPGRHRHIVGDVAVFSKYPIERGSIEAAGSVLPKVTVKSPIGDFSVIGVHTFSPTSRKLATGNWQQLCAVASQAEREARIVIVGDFNAPGHHPCLRSLVSADRSGGLVGGTWPSNIPVYQIDHVFIKGLRSSAREVVDVPGSDHKGVAVQIYKL